MKSSRAATEQWEWSDVSANLSNVGRTSYQTEAVWFAFGDPSQLTCVLPVGNQLGLIHLRCAALRMLAEGNIAGSIREVGCPNFNRTPKILAINDKGENETWTRKPSSSVQLHECFLCTVCRRQMTPSLSCVWQNALTGNTKTSRDIKKTFVADRGDGGMTRCSLFGG